MSAFMFWPDRILIGPCFGNRRGHSYHPQKLIILCHQNPSQNSSSPPSSLLSSKIGNVPLTPASPSPHSFSEHTTVLGYIWDGGKRSGTLFNSLYTFLKPDKAYLIPNCNVFYAYPHNRIRLFLNKVCLSFGNYCLTSMDRMVSS